MSSYNVRSPRADEFINHEEIFDTLAYAEAHKNDAALARSILEKARANLTPAHDHGTTLTHREASVLLACEDPEVNAEIRQLAATSSRPTTATVSCCLLRCTFLTTA